MNRGNRTTLVMNFGAFIVFIFGGRPSDSRSTRTISISRVVKNAPVARKNSVFGLTCRNEDPHVRGQDYPIKTRKGTTQASK